MFKIRGFLLFFLWVLLLSSPAHAFHSGGVGACDGCHTMHNTGNAVVYKYLIPASDASSVCLNCHYGTGYPGGVNIASPDGSAMTPGGDFYWLKKTFSWVGGSVPGERHGHNIVAQNFGFTQDVTELTAPGGTYLAANLGCNSCHDPHGKVGGSGNPGPVSGSGSYGGLAAPGTVLGSYRLLGGVGYNGGSQAGGYVFNNPAPVAAQNPLAPFAETNGSHVDYGSSMSEWCANCHNGMLNSEHQPGGRFQHPIGNSAHIDTSMVDNYNAYVKTGDLSGTRATAYLALVAFERGVTDRSLLNPTSTQGPDYGSNIMCLTCHRAHASAFKYAGRWDFTVQTIADGHPQAADNGVTGNDIYYAYYGRDIAAEYGAFQRSFCEKCHTIPRNGYPP